MIDTTGIRMHRGYQCPELVLVYASSCKHVPKGSWSQLVGLRDKQGRRPSHIIVYGDVPSEIYYELLVPSVRVGGTVVVRGSGGVSKD